MVLPNYGAQNKYLGPLILLFIEKTLVIFKKKKTILNNLLNL